MRLAILSDIHGNLPALEAVLSDIDRLGVDRILAAGDYVGGPYNNQVIQILQEREVWSIQGNGEAGILLLDSGAAPDYWYTTQQHAYGRWVWHDLTPESLAFINTLPEQAVFHLLGTDPIRVVHGSPFGLSQGIMPDTNPESLRNALAAVTEPVLVCGHTHKPWAVTQSGRLALNPGAVCGPLNGFVGAQYALLEWDGTSWQAELRAVSYDLAPVREAFHACGLYLAAPVFSKAILLCEHTGQDVIMDFLRYAYGLARENGYEDSPYVPDPIWEQAAKEYDWGPWGTTAGVRIDIHKDLPERSSIRTTPQE